MTALDRVVQALDGQGLKVKLNGKDRAMAICPAHNDKNPSLSLRQIRDRALICCHGGCQTEDVLAALNMTVSDLFDDPKQGVRYDYPHRTVYRSPGKAFRQVIEEPDVELYVPPGMNLVKAVADGKEIFIPEGEQDVDLLAAEHIHAVTSPMGAANWDKCDYSPLIGDGLLTIIADKDPAGRKRAEGLHEHLRSIRSGPVRVVEARAGKDVTDHVMFGYSVDELVQVTMKPTKGKLQPVYRTSLEEPAVVHWAWKGIVPIGVVTIAIGRGGVGKSTLLLWMAAQLQQGLLPGAMYGKETRVLIFAHEDSWNAVTIPRLIGNGGVMASEDGVPNFIEVRVPTEESNGVRTPKLPLDIDYIRAAVEEWDAQVIIIDPLISMVADELNANLAKDVRTALQPLTDLAEEKEIAVLAIAHLNKSAGSHSGDRMSGSHAWRDVARSTLVCALDVETGITYVSNEKNNYAMGSGGQHFHYKLKSRNVKTAVPNDDGEFFTPVAQVEWLGETTRTVDEVFAEEITVAKSGSLRNDILSFVKGSPGVRTLKEIMSQVSENHEDVKDVQVRKILSRMVQGGQLQRYSFGTYGRPGIGQDNDASLGPRCTVCGNLMPAEQVAQGFTTHPSCDL